MQLDNLPKSINIICMNNSNYIKEILHKKKLTRWCDDAMPIKIFIDHIVYGVAHEAEKYFTSQIKRAFSEWEKASEGKIITEFTEKKSKANIIIEWHWKSNSSFESDRCLGICQMWTNWTNKSMKKALIKVYIPIDRPISDVNEFYSIILHEIGHALGIFKHSSNKEDIMYKEKSTIGTLSVQDKNTIKLIYSLAPGTSENEIYKSSFMVRDNIFK